MSKIRKLIVFLIMISAFSLPSLAAEYDGDGIVEPGENRDEELRAASQNPMADLISIPIQNNTNFDYGPMEKTQNFTNIQPVIPFELNDDWNIISRTIMPLINQPGFAPGQDSKFGLGDINLSLFVGPSEPGEIIWGVGPIFSFPTATDDRLGTDKWSAGPVAVVLTMPKPWVFGLLGQNLWSFAGDSDRADVNQMLIQYFINYNLPDGWYLTTSPIITANWKADNDNKWTIPFGGGIGRLIFIDKLPLNMSAHGYYNVEKPDNVGPRWTLRCQIQTLLPKSLFQ